MSASEFHCLVEALAATPASIRLMVKGISTSDTHWKPDEGQFSVVEIICHLRDIEAEGYSVRITRMLREDQPLLEDLDGAKLAQERNYNNQALSEALDEFAQAREHSLNTLLGISFAQLTRTGTLENTGTITLLRLLELMREHDDSHTAELANLRGMIASLA